MGLDEESIAFSAAMPYRSNDTVESDTESEEMSSVVSLSIKGKPAEASLPILTTEAALWLVLSSETFTDTSVLAKRMGAKKSDLNPFLYRLLKENKVVKQAEADGTKPRWKRMI